MVGAIVRKEILGAGRHGRYYAIRGAYLLLLACVTIPTLLTAARRIAESPWAASRTGQDFTFAFGVLEFLLVAMLAPAFSIGAIAGEKATGGLDLLHAAGIGATRIVAGKFAARMAWLLLFVASGLPLFFAGTLLGGAGAATVALLTAHCVIASALGTALGFTFSGGMRQTVPALVLVYLVLLIVYAGIPLGLLFWSEGIAWSRVSQDWYAWVSPLASIAQYTDGNLSLETAWLTTVPHALVAVLALLPAFGFARPDLGPRPQRRGAAAVVRGAPSAAAAAAARSPFRPRIHGNPVAWRDARAARRGAAARILRISYLALGLLVIAGTIFVSVWHAIRTQTFHWSWQVFADVFRSSSASTDMARVAIFALVGGAGLVALVVAAGCIAEERDRRAMPLLRLSRLTSGELLLGKVWGLAVYLWPVAILPVVLSMIFFALRDPSAIVLTLMMVAVVVLEAVGFGLVFSAFARKTVTAVGVTVGLALVYMIVPPILVEFARFGSGGERLLAVVDPMVMAVELLDRFGRNWIDSTRFHMALAGLFVQGLMGAFFVLLSWIVLSGREEA